MIVTSASGADRPTVSSLMARQQGVPVRAVLIYESMYGNTHLIAEAIAVGLGDEPSSDVDTIETVVVPVSKASHELVASADLVVVGGPTHAHGMSRPSTRDAARTAADDATKELHLDPDAEGDGLRDWFNSRTRLDLQAAAFDTRMAGPPVFTGRASKGIAKQLERAGATMLAAPESFLVSRDNQLEPHEAERAREWGAELAAAWRAARA